MKVTTRDVLKVFWQTIRSQKWWALLIIFGILLGETLAVIAPWYYKRFFDVLAGAEAVDPNMVSESLFRLLLIIFALHGTHWFIGRFYGHGNAAFSHKIIRESELSSFNYLIRHSYRFFVNSFGGSLVRKVRRLSRAVDMTWDNLLWTFLPLIVTLIGTTIIIYIRSPLLAYVLIAWVAIYVIFSILFSKWKLKYDERRAKADSKVTATLADSITNSTNVTTYVGFEHEKKLFSDATEDYRKKGLFSWNLAELNEGFSWGLMVLIEFILMVVAIGLWKDGVLTVGDFAMLQGYMIGIFIRIWDLGRTIRKTYEFVADAKEMVEILQTPHEIKDAKDAAELKVTKGKIEFKDVIFKYRDGRRVLKGLNLTIKPKEKVALVGPSGAGKSTVIKILLRLFDVNQGKILIDNQDIKKVTQDSLRAAIAMVPQEPILFHRSLIDNIRYGKLDATDEEVFEAAKKAHCHEFIMKLKDKYETFVGERGVKLSGGERQRVVIARAILADAPILVLDEATSSLDSESEALIQDALEELMANKTTIVIAHRLSTILKMDRIVVIENGKAVDSGTHKQLSRKKGIYKTLWEIQAGGFIA